MLGSSNLWRWGPLVLAVGLVLGLLTAVGRGSGGDSPADRALDLREELDELRSRIGACLSQQDRMEARFEALVDRTERLGEEVEAFEGLDPEGVPAERYGAYLEAFEAYNEAIPEWERQGEALQEHQARCRAMVEAHNRRVDSLRGLLPQPLEVPGPPS